MALVKAQEEKSSEALNHMQDAMLEREMATCYRLGSRA